MRGYTFLELIIVLAVLTLVSAFVVPTYQLILSQVELSTTTQQVAELIRTAQQRTVTEQKTYGITVTAGEGSMPLFLYNSASNSKTTQTSITLPTNISLSQSSFSGATDITFTTAGSPTYSGYLVLTDSIRGRSRKLLLRPSGSVIDNGAEY
jgi:prepilin-type N-terminal cleavage/methylation domain-containing protein